MMRLGIITLLSMLRDTVTLEDANYDFIMAMKKEFDVVFIDPEEVDTVDFSIVLIGSGGTENYFRRIYGILPKPVILLTAGLHNSLAASLEILAWIRELGEESVILHGDVDETIEQIKYYYQVYTARKKLKEVNIGMLGFPSDWLIASDVNQIEAQRKWGISYNYIEFPELSMLIDEVSEDRANTVARTFLNNAFEIKEATERDVVEAAKVYLALKTLCEVYKLDALTLRCFEMISRHHTTACMALSLLNTEGIICACEGDMQSVFSMVLLNLLTGRRSFLTNPSRIDAAENAVVMAHCSIPLCMTCRYTIRSHFESQIGVGIQGEVEKGPVTIFKCGSSKLNRYFVSSGQILDNLDNANMCRTQLKIHLDENVGYFFKNPLANHHMVVIGEHTKIIDDFMQSMGCEKVL